MKILITGGHLTPALAVIDKLKGKHEVLYVGRKHAFEGDSAISFEYQTITKLGIPFYEIKTGRLQRKFTKYTVSSLLRIPSGFLGAYKILIDVKPDVVLGFGSYVSVPVGIAAKSLGIPLVIHEQILAAGFANRVLSKFADKICVSWKSSESYFPKKKTILTGNPLRGSVLNLKNQQQEKSIYISGGSLGSHTINMLILKIIKKLLKDFVVFHQTGDYKKHNDFQKLLELKETLPKQLADKYKLVKFMDVDEVSKNMLASSFVIGRSGINTVTELIYLKKAAILIPLSLTKHSEQIKNAYFFKQIGLGEVYLEEDLESEGLYDKIINFYKNIDKYQLKENVLVKESADKIISVLEDVYPKKAS